MPISFDQLCASVQTEIADTSTAMLTRIAAWANEFHFQLCNKRRWRWLEAISDSTLIKSTTYPFPLASLKVLTVTTPASKILDVLDVDYSPEYPLTESTVDAIRQSYADYATNTNGPAEFWYVMKNSATGAMAINLFPRPDTTGRNYTIRFRKAPVIMVLLANTPILVPDDWAHVLRAAIVSKAFRWLDDSRSDNYWKEHQLGVDDMERDDSTGMTIRDSRESDFRRSRLPLLAQDS